MRVKKCLSILLTLVMVLSLLPTAALADGTSHAIMISCRLISDGSEASSTVMPSVTSAAAGETVTLTVNAAPKEKLTEQQSYSANSSSSVTLTNGFLAYSSSEIISIEKIGDSYSFVMPDAEVTIIAFFDYFNYSITVNEPIHGHMDVYKLNGNEMTAVTAADEGDEIHVRLAANPDDPYIVTGMTYTYTENGVNKTGEITLTNEINQLFLGTFTMPASDVVINITDQAAHRIIYESSALKQEYFSKVTGETVTLTPENGYTVTRVYVKCGDEYLTVTANADGTFSFMMPDGDVTVFTEFSYIDLDGSAKASTPTLITGDMTDLGTGWYAVDGNITNNNRISVNGDVNLILCDGATLTAPKGISVNSGNSLTIWGQIAGSGALTAMIDENDEDLYYLAAIGGYQTSSGSITINGGTVTAKGGVMAAGIGGGRQGDGTVIINGGTVTAAGGNWGAGIGGGQRSGGTGGYGNVTINGGTVTATGGSISAGIGGGYNYDNNGTAGAKVVISGGVVNAIGGESGGVGIGGSADGSSISLGWTDLDDSITADSYSGTVTLTKAFTDGATVYKPGVIADNTEINGKTLTYSPPYTITVVNGENGAVTAPGAAAEGETVTLTVTPEAGYVLGTLTVTQGETTVETAAGGNNTYTFTMPAGDVTVSATFKQLYTVILDPGEGTGEPIVYSTTRDAITNPDAGSANSNEFYLDGDGVGFWLSFDWPDDWQAPEGRFFSDRFDADNGEEYMPSACLPCDPAITLTARYAQEASFSLSPAAFSLAPSDFDSEGYTSLSITAESLVLGVVVNEYGDSQGTADFLEVMPGKGTLTCGDAALSYQVYASDGWGDGDSMYLDYYGQGQTNDFKLFIDPDALRDAAPGTYTGSLRCRIKWEYMGVEADPVSIPLTLVVPAAGDYTVTVDSALHGTVTVDKTTAEKGETVTVTPQPADGYTYSGVVYAKTDDPTEFEWAVLDEASGNYTFEMPAYDVTVSLSEITRKSYSLDLVVTPEADHVLSIYDDQAQWGYSVSVSYYSDSGYQVRKIYYKIDGDNTEYALTEDLSGGYSFTMPMANVTIFAEIEAITYPVSVDFGAGHEAFVRDLFEGNDEYSVDGSVVTFRMPAFNRFNEHSTLSDAYNMITDYCKTNVTDPLDNNKRFMYQFGRKARSEYVSEEEFNLEQEGYSETPLNKDEPSTLYALWAEPAAATITVTPPECGTVLTKDVYHSAGRFTPVPELTVSGNASIRDESFKFTNWLIENADDYQVGDTVTLTGENTYSGRLFLNTEWGYFLDSSTAEEAITVVGGTLVSCDTDGKVVISVPVEHSYDEDGICTGCGVQKTAEPEFKSKSLVLSGQIGVNFYMNIPEGMTDGTMTFTVGERTTTAAGALQSDGRYKFTCYVNSVEMAEQITAVYSYTVNGETKTVSCSSSVKAYLEIIIQNENNLEEYAAATPLAKALYNYGYYAMQAVPGGSKHPAMPDTYIGDTTLITSLDGYAISATLDKDVITKASYSLDLDSETAINFYLTTETELTKNNVSVTAAAGTTFEYTVEKVGSRYRVQVTGIGAHELGTVFTMTTGGTTISASAMTYVQQSLANSNAGAATKNAAAALYEYYQQAISYNN